jgi:hypothetical protein
VATFDDIKSYYVNILQRDPSDDEVRSWEAPVNAGALTIDQVRQAFINSPEAQNVAGVIRVYQAAFGRVPDQEGLKNWANSGLSMDQIAEGFVNSEEFTNRYGSNNVTQAFVTSLYFQVLGRAPDAEGLANWTNSGLSAAQILAGFSESQEFKNSTTTAVATFLDNAGKGSEDYSGKLIEYTPAPEPVGQTFALTASVDSLVGGANSDTFNAIMKIDEISTVNALDSIDGGAGVDTLNISLGADSVLPSSATIKNVEIVNLVSEGGKLTGSGDGPIDASRFQGAEQIWQIDDASGITKLGANTTAGFRTVNSADLSVTADTGVAAVKIALDNVAGNDEGSAVALSVAGTGLNSVSVSGTITENATYTGDTPATLALDIDLGKDQQTLTVDTAVNTQLTVDDSASAVAKKLTTLNAGNSTGGVAYNGAPTVSSVTTGTGDDSVSISFVTAKATATTAAKNASVYTADGDDIITVSDANGTGTTKVDGGHGDNTVTVNGNTSVDAKVEVISGDGIDTVSISGRSGTVDVSVGKGNDDIKIGSGYKGITVNAGQGDDVVHVMDADHEGYRTLTDTDSLDGGEGVDTIVVGAEAMTDSGDYIRLANLTSFEHVRFTEVVGTEEVALDAAELKNFSQIEVTGHYEILSNDEGVYTPSYVKNVSADQTIVVNSSINNLGLARVFAEGYDDDVDAVDGNAEASALNLKVQDSYAGISAFAKSVNLTVEATNESGGAAAFIGDSGPSSLQNDSDIDSATINLVSTVDAEAETVSIASANVESANAGSGFTNLTIKGTGSAYVDNIGGKLTTINASGLGGTDLENNPFQGLQFRGDFSVKETVSLGSGVNGLNIASRAGNASLDKMDTITGFKLVMNEAKTDFIEGSDQFNLGLTFNDNGSDSDTADDFWSAAGEFKTTAEKFVAHTFESTPTSLGAALNTVSALADKAVVFKYGNDSYIYAENENGSTENQNFEASDMLVKLVGITDVDALAKAASLSMFND